MPGSWLRADLPTMFMTDEFAHCALITSGEHAGLRVPVQFHDPYNEQFGQSGASPSCLVQGHQIPGLSVEDTVEITGGEMVSRRYRINAIEPDGHGVTTLTLADG